MPTFSNNTGIINQFDFKDEAAKMQKEGLAAGMEQGALTKSIGKARTANSIGAGFGVAEGVLGAIAPAKKVIDGITMSKDKKMDSKGNITHKPDMAGNTLGMASAGYNIGKNFGPWGAAIGAVGGAIIGGVGTLLDKPPSFAEVQNKRNQFDLGIATQSIRGEDTFAKQQLMAEDGMDVKGGTKQIEVERDELVLRKNGKAFKVVADFKGGKTHGQGGEQFVAQEGDIIFPGKDRNKIGRLINNRRWSAIESARLALPVDTKEGMAKDGIGGVKNDKKALQGNKKTTRVPMTGKAGIKTLGGSKKVPTNDELAALKSDRNWRIAMTRTGKAEGGISTDVKDRGNYYSGPLTDAEGNDVPLKVDGKYNPARFVPTRHGLILDSYVGESGKAPKTVEELKAISSEFEKSVDKNAAEQFFKKNYWDKNSYGLVEDELTASNMFDASINQGWKSNPANPQNNINVALGIQPTKDIKEWAGAVNKTVAEKGSAFVNDSLANRRVEKYQGSKTWNEHGKGWVNRIGTYASPQAMDTINKTTGFEAKSTLDPKYDTTYKTKDQPYTIPVPKPTEAPIEEMKETPTYEKGTQAVKLGITTDKSGSANLSTVWSSMEKTPKYAEGTAGVKTTSTKSSLSEKQVQMFMDKHSKGVPPITAEELMKLAAENNFPLELLLIQGAQESGFGTMGAARTTHNIFNVGNVTAGDNLSAEEAKAKGHRKDLGSWADGVKAYINLMKKEYLPKVNGEWEKLLNPGQFTRKKDNARYATHPEYEAALSALKTKLDTITPEKAETYVSKKQPATKEVVTDKKEYEGRTVPKSAEDLGIIAAPDKLTTTKGALSSNEEYNKQRLKVIEASKRAGKNEVETQINIANHKKNFEAKLNANVNTRKATEKNPGFYNREIGPGKKIAERNSKRTEEWKVDSILLPGFIESGVAKIAGSLESRIRGGATQEVQITDEKLAKQADAIYDELNTWGARDRGFWMSLLGEGGQMLDAVTALQSGLLFGQSFEGSTLHGLSGALTGMSDVQFKKTIELLKSKGLITDDKGIYLLEQLRNRPEAFTTTQMKANQALDIGTIIINPKGILVGGKLLFKGGKGLLAGAGAAGKEMWKALKGNQPVLNKFLRETFGDAQNLKFSGVNSYDDMLALTKDIKDSGGAIPTQVATNVEAAKEAKGFFATIGEAASKGFHGSSLDEVKDAKKTIEELTGSTYAELRKLPQKEVAQKVVNAVNAKVDDLANLNKTAGDAWDAHKNIAKSVDEARVALREARKGAVNAEELAMAEKTLAKYEGLLVTSEEAIVGIAKRQEIAVANMAGVNKFMGNNVHPDKLKELVASGEYAGSRIKELEGASDALKEATAIQKGIASNVEGLGKIVVKGKVDVPKVAEGIDNLIKANVKATESAKAARQSQLIANKAAKALTTPEAIAEATRLKELADKFPKAFNLLETSENLSKAYKSGKITLVQVAKALRQEYMDKDNPDTELETELTALETVESDGVSLPKEEEAKTVVEDGGAEDEEFLTSIEKDTTPTEEEKVAEEVPAGEVSAMPKIGDALLKGFGNLAAYAPAIYNISKGLEKPDKVDRRFVSPQTKKYENMSQPQMNMIDDAFNAAVGNARNTSGGMMSNFRSNVENAWAGRIKNTAQVNAFEAERADKVASENINTMNAAQQYNQEVAGKADVMDMQSKATTNAFLAQGMQDVANITSRNRADAMALRNQEITRNAISSGTNMTLNPDGTISFNPGSLATKTGTSNTTTPTTTVAPVIGGAPVSKSIIQTPVPLDTPADYEYYDTEELKTKR